MRTRSTALRMCLLASSLLACNSITGLDDYAFDRDAARAGSGGSSGNAAGGGNAGASGATSGGAAGVGGSTAGGAGTAGSTNGGAAGSQSGAAGSAGGPAGSAGASGSAGTSAGASGAAGTTAGASGAAGANVAGAAGQGGGGGGAAGAPSTCTVSATKTCNGKVLSSCPAGTPVVEATCQAHELCDPDAGCVKPVRLFAGERHACAIMSDTSVMCWGANDEGQLGRKTKGTADGGEPAGRVLTTSTQDTPLRNVKQLALGNTFTCALVDDGDQNLGVHCWGSDSVGQLGDGAATSPRTAVNVKFPVDLGTEKPLVSAKDTTLSAHGDTACVVTTSANTFCWGSGLTGQLATTANSSGVPLKVNLTNVSSVAVGGFHVCAIQNVSTSGRVRCWGSRYAGQLGDGVSTADSVNVPQTVLTAAASPLVVFADSMLVATGDEIGALASEPSGSTCVTRSGKVFCWGSTSLGEVGKGSFSPSFNAYAVATSEVASSPLASVSAAEITMGGGHACVRDGTAKTLCWGSNVDGAIGISTPPDKVALPTGAGFAATSIAAGGFLYPTQDPLDQSNFLLTGRPFTCALDAAGIVVCIGNNKTGQLGVPVGAKPRTQLVVP